MRLKEDNSSWQSNGIKRRDFRHDPSQPEKEISTGTKKKNKKHQHQITVTFLRWQKNYRGEYNAVWKMSCECGYNRSTPIWRLRRPSNSTIIHEDVLPPRPEA